MMRIDELLKKIKPYVLGWSPRTMADLRDFGRFNTGDDITDILQSALDTLTAGTGLVIPGGEYLISDTVAFTNKSGARLFGSGMANMYTAGTKLRWTGSAGGVLLNMSGCFGCKLEGVGFFANASAEGVGSTQIGLRVLGNPTYNGSFFNTIESCYFQNFGTAIELGTNGGTDQVDSMTIEKCWFYYGADGIGINNRSSNALINVIRNCGFTTVGSPTTATGILVERGGVKVRDCASGLNHIGIRIVAPEGLTSIIGFHTERDDYGIYTDATSSGNQKARPVLVEDCFGYDPQIAFMYLANANILYTLQSIYSVKVTASDVILVPDAFDGLTIHNMVTTDGVKRISDGVTVEPIYGRYGVQAVTPWKDIAPDTIYPSGLGAILTDRGDYTKSRLKVTNGTLGIEQVTNAALCDQLKAYYKLSDVNDASGNGHTLTNNNVVTFGAGKIGNCAEFVAASSQSLSVGDHADLSTGDIDFTITCWLKIASGVTTGVFTKLAGAAIEYAVILIGGVPLFYVKDAAHFAQWGSALSNGVWHFIVCWHDKTADTLNLQVDNGAIISTAVTGGPPDTAAALQLGYNADVGYLSGNIDEYGFWKRVLTASERAELWNGGNGKSWPF